MEIATWEKEKEFWKKGYALVIGIDEAGRGPLAGPVVAAAAVLKERELAEDKKLADDWRLVRDSKSLSILQKKRAFQFVQENFRVGVGIISQQTIDRVNILEATFLAMKSALTDLKRSIKETDLSKLLLVDGSQVISNFSGEQRAIKQGDKTVKSIAAASIVAKVTRDKIMKKYAFQYPQYGFEKHKGYGTKEHLEALKKYGPTPLHRFSFRPVKKLRKLS